MPDAIAGRIARELETREADARKQAWTPPPLLPTPDARPGWAHKYVRISTMGQLDPTNASAMFREGWEPVKAAEYPELMHQRDEGSKYKDNIEIGGLLLCRAREEMVAQRRDYYQKMAEAQMNAVDNSFMKAKDARSNMELFNESRRTVSSFGRGSK